MRRSASSIGRLFECGGPACLGLIQNLQLEGQAARVWRRRREGMRATAFERSRTLHPCRSARQPKTTGFRPIQLPLTVQLASPCSLPLLADRDQRRAVPLPSPGLHQALAGLLVALAETLFRQLPASGACCWRGAASRTAWLLQLAARPAAGPGPSKHSGPNGIPWQ